MLKNQKALLEKGMAFFRETGEIVAMSSARSALVQGLKASGLGRMDEILIPPFMCQAVLSAMSRTSFPVMSPSSRTKAILVFHQFGFPQKIDQVGPVVKKKKWLIVGDCAHTAASRYKGQNVRDWGDFSVLSFSKILPCALGGAFITRDRHLAERLRKQIGPIAQQDQEFVTRAYTVLDRTRKGKLKGRPAVFQVAGVYGYLPELVSFPVQAVKQIPKGQDEWERQFSFQRQAWQIVQSILPQRVPRCPESDIVPWAIPIRTSYQQAEKIIARVESKYGISLSCLHFDFSRNMLRPDYQPAVVVEVSSIPKEKFLLKVCEEIKKIAS